MSELPKVQIINPDPTWKGTKYKINGVEVPAVKSVDFRVAVGELNSFIFEMYGFPDIDMYGDILFKFHPETVKEAVAVLQNELSNGSDLRGGFIASIESALNEAKPYTGEHALAEAIMDRIVGK